MGTIVLILYGFYVLLAFGVRSVVHWRRTGSTGFKGVGGRFGSVEWAGGVLFIVALVLGIAAPVLDIAGVLSPFVLIDGGAARVLGLALYVLGLAGTLLAQFSMGESWRIGVDEDERTALVTGGPFSYVRNPIFSAMLLAFGGLVLLVPNVVAITAWVAILAAIEIQVRAVEEPYLLLTHGATYAHYASHVGRFVPTIGTIMGRSRCGTNAVASGPGC